MPVDPEIGQLVSTESHRLTTDQNRPYTVRRRKAGIQTSKGAVDGSVQYDYRTINNMRTQPLGDKEFNRLPEGERDKTWRFAMVIPEEIGSLPSSQDEFLDFNDQVQYKNHWYEVKMINDWDLIQGCKMVFVE